MAKPTKLSLHHWKISLLVHGSFPCAVEIVCHFITTISKQAEGSLLWPCLCKIRRSALLSSFLAFADGHCPLLQSVYSLLILPSIRKKSWKYSGSAIVTYRKKWINNIHLGFPGGASGKEPTCQCRRHKRCRFDPWVRKIPWRRAWQPTPVFLPGESYGQRSLGVYSP